MKYLPIHPSYSQICRRINKLNITTRRSDDNDNDDGVIVTRDSTGIMVTNRGQWMHQENWHIKKKKGYLKIHIAGVNIKTKEILALEVTDEKSHNKKFMPKLIEYILKRRNYNIKIKSTLGNGSYDSNKNFKYL